MSPESRNCESCNQAFTIEPPDFAFYKKMEVPPPTWCPDCRMRRRMAFVNERSFFWAICGLCNKKTLSIIDPEKHNSIYCPKCWWSDSWDPMKYGRAYNFSKPFFQQFKELHDDFPKLASGVTEGKNVNSPYINMSSFVKNCYMVFQSDYDEDCLYSAYLEASKNCTDVTFGDKLENCYGSISMGVCYRTFYSTNCSGCTDVWFSRDLSDCSNCFGCIGLKHKQYYFFNEPLSKTAYEAKLAEINTGSWKTVVEMKERAKKLFATFPRRFMMGFGNEDVTGEALFRSKNAKDCYQSMNIQDARYCQFMYYQSTKDVYDISMWGGGELQYECSAIGAPQQNMKFDFLISGKATNIEFSWLTTIGADDLFGCIGLQKKQYCILNKKYTKEEYEALVPKIKKQMDEMPYTDVLGREYHYGQFFPPELAPCAYNDSIAQIYLPLTKEQALKAGYLWRDEKEKEHQSTITDLPDDIQTVTDEILKEVIACAHGGKCTDLCSAAFKIIPEELAFYRTMKLPLPRLCSNCRNKERLAENLPMKIWKRNCMCATAGHDHAGKCEQTFSTAYAPERPEIIYCETCYQLTVG